jgi:hypothetical protein
MCSQFEHEVAHLFATTEASYAIPSDLSDEEASDWPRPAKRCYNRRTVDVREVVNGPMYELSTGC